MWIRSYDLFAVQFEDKAKHTVCSRMLWAKVHCVVPNFALIGSLALV